MVKKVLVSVGLFATVTFGLSAAAMAAPNPNATFVIAGGIGVAAGSISYAVSGVQGFSFARACRRAR